MMTSVTFFLFIAVPYTTTTPWAPGHDLLGALLVVLHVDVPKVHLPVVLLVPPGPPGQGTSESRLNQARGWGVQPRAGRTGMR